jgi:hypothetical protein
MRRLTAVFLAILVNGCTGALDAPSRFEELVVKHRSDASTSSGRAYEPTTISALESHRAPVTPECAKLRNSLGKLEYVLVLDDQGRVTEAVGAAGTESSACLTNEFASARFPAPPFAPFHVLIEETASP